MELLEIAMPIYLLYGSRGSLMMALTFVQQAFNTLKHLPCHLVTFKVVCFCYFHIFKRNSLLLRTVSFFTDNVDIFAMMIYVCGGQCWSSNAHWHLWCLHILISEISTLLNVITTKLKNYPQTTNIAKYPQLVGVG